MNFLTHRFSLDMNETSAQLCLSCKKNDTGIKLVINLTDNGRPYEIADGCIAVFTATKADGTTLYNYCIIQNNTIIYTFTEQTVSCAGKVDVEIRLSDSEGVITSPGFILIVDETIMDDSDMLSSSEATALIALIGEANEAVETTEAAVKEANTARDAANDAAESANDAASAANAAAGSANAAAERANNAVENIEADHINNHNNPHQVTAEQVGAAPTGYGIGGDSKPIIDDVNNALIGGVYQCAYNIKNGPPGIGNFTLFAQQHGPSEVIHTAKSVLGRFAERVGVRDIETDVWTFSEWEYANPPLLKDVEYRTTERIDNKAVYKKKDSSGQILYRLDGETEWKTQHNLMGAAPAGYGIGTEGKEITDVNDALVGGVYFAQYDAANVPPDLGNCVIFVEKNGGSLVFQTARGAHKRYAERTGIKARNSDIWTFEEWRYVNPPMFYYTEYITTEQYEGKPVYAQKLNYGALPNTSGSAHNMAAMNVKEIIAFGGSTSDGKSLPYELDTSIKLSCWKRSDSVISFNIVTDYDCSGLTATTWAKYTKTTD